MCVAVVAEYNFSSSPNSQKIKLPYITHVTVYVFCFLEYKMHNVVEIETITQLLPVL